MSVKNIPSVCDGMGHTHKLLVSASFPTICETHLPDFTPFIFTEVKIRHLYVLYDTVQMLYMDFDRSYKY